MQTLPKTITNSFFINPETGYNDLKERWVNTPSKDKKAGHHFVYQILRGRNWQKAFVRSAGDSWSTFYLLDQWKQYLDIFAGIVSEPGIEFLDTIIPKRYTLPHLFNSYDFGWIYIVVRTDIQPVHQLVQASHAAYIASKHTTAINPNFVVLGVENLAELYKIKYAAKDAGIQLFDFVDSVPTGRLEETAFCTAPLIGVQRDIFKDYRTDTIMV